MPYIDVCVDTEVWVELDDFDDEDISEEYHRRNLTGGGDTSLQLLFDLKRLNSPDFDKEFANYCWEKLGRVL